jgi:hypothetical protein
MPTTHEKYILIKLVRTFTLSLSTPKWYISQFLLLTYHHTLALKPIAANMPSTLDRIIESFPHPTILPIVGQPTYETLAEVHLKLNTNAASVQSHLGNGILGLLYLTVSPAVYNTQSATAFIAPINPGPSPTIPPLSTGPQIADIRSQHDVKNALYKEYDATDKALKSLLLSTVDETYVRSLRDKYIGYANVTTLQMITHLYTSYAKISESDLEENDARMKADYDVNQPIEVLIDQIDDAVDMAAAGKTPYTPEQVVTIAYTLIFKTGLFADDCKIWRRRTTVEKTWTEFKRVFTLAHQELRESTHTSKGSGFHSANNAVTQDDFNHDIQQETVDAIANLATATASDRATVASLTATNSRLTLELIAVNAKLVKALEANKQRQVTTTGGRSNTTTRGRASTTTNGDRERSQKTPGPHYCFKCGSNVWHTSARCWSKKAGHQDEATEENKMGGSTQKFQAE